MHPGHVIGRVVCNQHTPELEGITLLLIQPTDWEGNPTGAPLVASDCVGAGAGEFIFFVQSREAAVTLPSVPSVDAGVVGIIDGVNLIKELL